ncbi:amidase [Maritalea sp.]|uniref:amidase n=1 Tax=Maritalea sp. TaxID=2003361 RepID=UPI003EF89871
MTSIEKRSAVDIHHLLEKDHTQLETVLRDLSDRYENEDGDINAFAQYFAIEKPSGDGWLKGLPVSVKDQFHVAGKTAQFGMSTLPRAASKQNATCIQNLLNSGATVIGKTNLPPLAMDFQCLSGNGVRTNNPHNLEYTTGGSSGGSAAAVASGMSLLDIGADLSGSLRIPAGFCGVMSLLPTEGALPTGGMLVDPARKLAHFARPGPIARTADDLWLGFCALRGDQQMPDALSELNAKGNRIAVWDQRFEDPVDQDTGAIFQKIGAKLEASNLQVECLSQNIFDTSSAHLFGRIMGFETGELMSFIQRKLARFFGRSAEARSPRFLKPVQDGYKHDRKDYADALSAQKKLTSERAKQLDHVDAILAPLCPVAPFKHIAPSSDHNGLRDYQHHFDVDGRKLSYLDCVTYYTTPVSLLGLPVVTIRVGTSSAGLPIGAQLIGKAGQERELLELAKLIERLYEA